MKIPNGAIVLEPRDIYDDAIVRVDGNQVVYNSDRVIECGIKLFGDWETSANWHEFNTFGTYFGENNPIFIMDEIEFE